MQYFEDIPVGQTARFGHYEATVTAKDMGWSGRQPAAEFKVGYLCEFKIREVDEAGARVSRRY